MITSDAWNLARIDRPTYELSEKRPLRVAAKLHPKPTEERFDMHYALELGIQISGHMDRLYRGHRRSVSPGDIWLCGSWEPHGFQVTSAPCEAVVVNIFPPMLATPTFPELGHGDWLGPFVLAASERPAVPDSDRREVLAFARELIESQSLRESQRSLAQRMLVYQALVALPRIAPARVEPDVLDAHVSINRAIELVFNQKDYVSSAEAARHCGLPPKAFCRLFQHVTGVSFRNFALRYRLQSAATQLLTTHQPIKEIATDWGFTDASHFHVSFQAVYGCSPAHYRNAAGPTLEARNSQF